MVMRMMPKLLLLLFSMSVVTMVFIARCGLNIESQVGPDHSNGGMPTSDGHSRSPGEKALREVLRRKEVEHFRDKSALQEKIKTLEGQLVKDAAIPSFHDQLVLSKDTGFWRDFGYGMTCQYRSDFLKIKGFDEQITGWGGEDVFLYQKFVRSDYFVIRATDPAIFHLWHEKYCDPNLTAEQYRSCIRSKALNEASHPQLGLLAFKDEIDVHRSVSERNILKAGGGIQNLTSNLKPPENEAGAAMDQREGEWSVTKNPLEFFPADMMLMKNDVLGRQPQQQQQQQQHQQRYGVPNGNRFPPVRYDETGRVILSDKVKPRRARPVGGDVVQSQRRVIRGQSDDYPLLDARMSQDFFPENNNNNNNNDIVERKMLQKDARGSNARFEGGNDNRVERFGNDRANINNDNNFIGREAESNILPPANMGINAAAFRYQRSVLEADQLKTVLEKPNSTDHQTYINDRLKAAEIQNGVTYKTEYELIPFNRFVFNRIFLTDPGLGKRVVGKPIGSKKRDLNEILAHAINSLNANRTQEQTSYSHDDFIEGIHRTDPATGTHYELIFRNKETSNDNNSPNKKKSSSAHSYIKIDVVRPFAPPMTIQRQAVNTDEEWINIILPLSGRLDTFRIFLNQFINVCIKQDRRVYLTVVYFGTTGLSDVKTMMSKVAKSNKFKHMKLITLNEKFTRGRALQIGALNWKHGDVLLFFCDVDIVFTAEFLERCRLNTARSKRVYYPIVFSLYNPNIVYSLQDAAIPSFHDQLVLSKDTGFWRDFGYGMTCQYRSDFLKIKGFDEQITGWGGEDVFLYQKFVRSDYFVIRATDPAIFHLWHEKYCDPNLTAEQYRSCIRSKALNEASHPQLGLLAFKDEIDVHRSVSERNILKAGGGVSSSRISKRRTIQDVPNTENKNNLNNNNNIPR